MLLKRFMPSLRAFETPSESLLVDNGVALILGVLSFSEDDNGEGGVGDVEPAFESSRL